MYYKEISDYIHKVYADVDISRSRDRDALNGPVSYYKYAVVVYYKEISDYIHKVYADLKIGSRHPAALRVLVSNYHNSVLVCTIVS